MSLEGSEIRDGWGPDAGIKGRVSEEALELAGVDHSLQNVGKAEKHTAVHHGPPPRGTESEPCSWLHQTAGPTRVHKADSHMDCQPGHPVSPTPRVWEAHLTATAHTARLVLTRHPQKCVLLYGSLCWLILAPENNFSSLPVSILGINLFSPSPCFWGCVMVTISMSRRV